MTSTFEKTTREIVLIVAISLLCPLFNLDFAQFKEFVPLKRFLSVLVIIKINYCTSK